MLKRWIRKKKFSLMNKWASDFGLYVVEIKNADGREYIVDGNGAWRRLATKGKNNNRAKR